MYSFAIDLSNRSGHPHCYSKRATAVCHMDEIILNFVIAVAKIADKSFAASIDSRSL